MISDYFSIKKIGPEIPVLLMDDDKNVTLALETLLLSIGFEMVYSVNDPQKLEKGIADNHARILFLDENIGSVKGSDLIGNLICKFPGIQIIMMTAVNDIELVVRCMQAGAADYLVKPVNEARLTAALLNACKKLTMIDEMQSMKSYLSGKSLESPDDFGAIVTKSEQLLGLFKYIEAVSRTPLPILITGETGVGKELFANAIHKSSKAKGKFVAFNAAGVDDNFFSDTLFGHKSGAFTGADQDRLGLLQQAENGTLFLDEIGELQMGSQVKLLRLLQEKEYMPLGSDQSQASNAKIICATNRNLSEEVKKGHFRSDLYYRLSSHVITVPALRDRINDLEVLLPTLIKKHSRQSGKIVYPKELIPILSHYGFPGNIRELEMMVADAVAVVKGSVLALEPFLQKLDLVRLNQDSPEKSLQMDIKIEDFPSLREIELEHIKKALDLSEGNQSVASRLLGITRQTLGKRLKEDS